MSDLTQYLIVTITDLNFTNKIPPAAVLGVDHRVADLLRHQRDLPGHRRDQLPGAPHLRPLRHLEQAHRAVRPPRRPPRLLQQVSSCSRVVLYTKCGS